MHDAQAIPEQLQQVMQTLEDLRSRAQSANPDGRSLQHRFLTAQQICQQTLLPEAMVRSHLVPHATEITRALRLLAMDVSFLQASRQPMTRQKRQAEICDRCDRLLGYCQAMLAQWDAPSAHPGQNPTES